MRKAVAHRNGWEEVEEDRGWEAMMGMVDGELQLAEIRLL